MSLVQYAFSILFKVLVTASQNVVPIKYIKHFSMDDDDDDGDGDGAGAGAGADDEDDNDDDDDEEEEEEDDARAGADADDDGSDGDNVIDVGTKVSFWLFSAPFY